MQRTVLLSQLCPSVRPSVCQMRVLWRNEMMHCGYFDITRKGNHSSFLTPTVVGARRPFPVKYSPKVTTPLRKTSISIATYAHVLCRAAWCIPIQVVVPDRPICPCFSCLPNSYGISGAGQPCTEPLAVPTTAQWTFRM